ncbi:hypothetical protein PPNSA23_39990 [Phyllobacterium phragmitis]|uniref:Transposase n=1 Tax=Phyllobacterium phragmitis TaxID=2670329 RepID=A0ABQ0H573_9HYPH
MYIRPHVIFHRHKLFTETRKQEFAPQTLKPPKRRKAPGAKFQVSTDQDSVGVRGLINGERAARITPSGEISQ